MQLIHVRVYGTFQSTYDRYWSNIATGESEYWFALIKVVLIVVFIIVGLIYDWGGVIGHPGPVSPRYSLGGPILMPQLGPLELPERPSIHRRVPHVCADIRLRLLLVRWC